ncbi:MAG: DUF512 domain-containing protein [Oscillospiraceae bacterium]|jgi:putative radical SAM enzyme (TIGR03279 family)|nr:DUF512 domain-containing protein [Oscillospiraceae bacterium]
MTNAITEIERASPLRGKARVGERLVSINGNEIFDVLDYKYYSYEPRLELVFEGEGGSRRRVRVKKSAGAELGLSFESYLMDAPHECSNHCLFCFVEQNPQGLRRSLYFKDDDARLSFLTGSYITLTNLSEREISRLIDLKISPINISVHATNPALRAKLLGNKEGADILPLMRALAEGGITMNCQLVCCPGLNDGQELSRTMEDLAQLYPRAASVSVVPVGLTKHREGRAPLAPVDAENARETLALVEGFAEKCLEKHGSRIFFPADEYYIKAALPVPLEEFYEDYPQLENGVGLLRLFEAQFLEELEACPPESAGADFSIATGRAAAPFLEKLLVTAQEKCGNIKGRVFSIENIFFGDTIDVAGLITGGDLIEQLRGRSLGERLLIPATMLRHGEGIFLDDVTVSDVERELGVSVSVVEVDGAKFLKNCTGRA